MHGPLDVIIPDELTIGQGTTSNALTGGYAGHQAGYEFEGEGESTYAALTWDIPSIQDPMLTRDERREIRNENYAADLAVAVIEEEAGAVRPVPEWFPWVIGGGLGLFLLAAALYSRREPQW